MQVDVGVHVIFRLTYIHIFRLTDLFGFQDRGGYVCSLEKFKHPPLATLCFGRRTKTYFEISYSLQYQTEWLSLLVAPTSSYMLYGHT